MYRNGFGAVAAGLLVVASFGHAAAGAMQPSASSERAYTPVYGRTLPPVGFVEFCARQKTECEPVSSSRRASLTKASWMKLAEVNAYVNGSIEPVSEIGRAHV
jgi:predicted transglutaminase-like cysteine proteinase